jgi:hypothetical protein
LVGNASCLCNAREVPNNHRLCCGELPPSLIRPPLVSSMQYHAVALFNKKPPGRKTGSAQECEQVS